MEIRVVRKTKKSFASSWLLGGHNIFQLNDRDALISREDRLRSTGAYPLYLCIAGCGLVIFSSSLEEIAVGASSQVKQRQDPTALRHVSMILRERRTPS